MKKKHLRLARKILAYVVTAINVVYMVVKLVSEAANYGQPRVAQLQP